MIFLTPTNMSHSNVQYIYKLVINVNIIQLCKNAIDTNTNCPEIFKTLHSTNLIISKNRMTMVLATKKIETRICIIKLCFIFFSNIIILYLS